MQFCFVLFIYLAMLCDVWDRGSLSRDQTHTPCSESAVLTTGRPGMSLHAVFTSSTQCSALCSGQPGRAGDLNRLGRWEWADTPP